MKWFLWWVVKYGGGQWYGPRNLTDYQAFQEQLAIYQGTDYVEKLYRLVWDGTQWNYDTRPDSELVSQSVKFSWI